MKKIDKRIKKIYYFFQILSPIGIIIAFGSIIVLYRFIRGYIELMNIREAASIGDDITGYFYFPRNENIYILGISIFVFAYIFLFTFILIITREKLRRAIIRKRYELNQNLSSYRLKILVDNLKTSIFLVHAKINIRNLSSGGHKVQHNSLPRAFLNHDTFTFSLSDLPSGIYRIESVLFYIKGPFGLFDGKFIYEEKVFANLPVFEEKSARPDYKYTNLFEGDGKSVFTKDATEDFYPTRKYQWGDELRKIHWKQTAKTRELMIRYPESKPVSYDEINIILNLHTPYLREVDQSEQIGKFLDNAISTIKNILASNDNRINIFINGKRATKIVDLQLYNQDKISLTILQKCEFQQKFPYKSLIKRKGFRNVVVMSMSSDEIYEEKGVRHFVFMIEQDEKISIKDRMKKIFLYEKEEYSGISRMDFLEKINFMGSFRRSMNYNKYIRQVRKNEKVIKNIEKVQYLNE